MRTVTQALEQQAFKVPKAADGTKLRLRRPGDAVQKLAPPAGFNKLVFEGRWVNNDPGRIEELARDSGYSVWQAGGKAGDYQGSIVKIRAGTRGVNSDTDRDAIFMFRPRQLREQQDAIWREEMERNTELIDPRKVQDKSGNVVPLQSADAQQFTGAIDLDRDG